MKLIIGLGNPGPEYMNTRHNVGFMVLDSIQEKLDFEAFSVEKKFRAEISIGEFNEEKIALAKPQTFMNLSGESVQKIMSYYKINPEDCLVIYDDLDTPYSKIRIRPSGGPGTHNGMKSIINLIGDKFPRLRVGIESRGDTSAPQMDASSFVLSNFNQEEQKNLPEVLKSALNATITLLEEGIDTAMNKFNN